MIYLPGHLDSDRWAEDLVDSRTAAPGCTAVTDLGRTQVDTVAVPGRAGSRLAVAVHPKIAVVAAGSDRILVRMLAPEEPRNLAVLHTAADHTRPDCRIAVVGCSLAVDIGSDHNSGCCSRLDRMDLTSLAEVADCSELVRSMDCLSDK